LFTTIIARCRLRIAESRLQ